MLVAGWDLWRGKEKAVSTHTGAHTEQEQQ